MTALQNVDGVPLDFDGTTANTFTPSANGLGVHGAYAMALRAMFGSEQLFDDIGGLQNRAPPQVIAAVLDLRPSLTACGLNYHDLHRKELDALVPPNKGSECNNDPARVLTETLVRVRLSYLLPQICSEWPKPYDGVLDFIEESRRQGKVVPIISSGHTRFIERAFEVWGVECPELLVTDDDMRTLGLPPEEACKPSKALMDMLHTTAARGGIKVNVLAYVGDCPIRDRAFAWNSNVRFGWFNPAKSETPEGFGVKECNEFQFHDWNDLHTQLN